MQTTTVIAKENGVPPLIMKRKDGTFGPMVDKRGFMVPIADLDESFVKQSVNTKTYSILRHVR